MKRGQAVDKLLVRIPIPFDFYAHRMSSFLCSVFAYRFNRGTNFNDGFYLLSYQTAVKN